jgi:hypothetical protein
MVDINPYGEKFTGFSKEEIASQPFFWKIFLPEYIRDRVLDVVEEAKKREYCQAVPEWLDIKKW